MCNILHDVERLATVDRHCFVFVLTIRSSIHATGIPVHGTWAVIIPPESPSRSDARVLVQRLQKRPERLVQPNGGPVQDAPLVAGVVRIAGRRTIETIEDKNDRNLRDFHQDNSSYIYCVDIICV